MDSPEKLATGRKKKKKHDTRCVGHLMFCHEKVDI